MRSNAARFQTSGSVPRRMLALLYDIHGNLPALEAVLADASDADRFLFGGDVAGFGAWPAETVERLRELDARVDPRQRRPLARRPLGRARGDARRCWRPPPRCSATTVVAELASLPETTTRDGVLYCHASPLSDMESFLPEPGDRDAELLMGTEARRVVFGHTHLAFMRGGPGGDRARQPGQRRDPARRRPARRLRAGGRGRPGRAAPGGLRLRCLGGRAARPVSARPERSPRGASSRPAST